MKLLFLDTETTGLIPGINGVIQVAGIIDIDGEVKETFDFKCKPFPDQVVEPEALMVSGITMDQIRSFDDPLSVYRRLRALMDMHVDRYDKADKFYLVGQNVKFDYDMMTHFFTRCGDGYLYAYVFYHLIDLISISALFKAVGMLNLPNLKLAMIADHFQIEHKAHDAMSDVEVCRKLFYLYADIIKKNGGRDGV